MNIAILGLGKMGLGIAKKICLYESTVYGYDKTELHENTLPQKNFFIAKSLIDLINILPAPRVIWLMLPSGLETENTIFEISSLLSPNDIVIDGSNSYYKDSQRRAGLLLNKGIEFVDIGVSGGIRGAEDGYCLMIGGTNQTTEKLAPLFNMLSFNGSNGWSHLGPIGSGHFAKMIHNGIEYGMMQSLAEGLELLKSNNKLSIDPLQLAELWRNGSVIRSWLLDLLSQGLKENPNLEKIMPFVPDSGEGRWFVIEAVTNGIPTPVISQALSVRLQSQNSLNYGLKALSVMRNMFGGHKIF